ncbi:MAG TPA: tetratricopeptide repeat protein [Xanthomonadaceae bacterium]|jgi:TolB-like protein/thioredoxin-like negative regulator of GroEL
MSRHPSFLAELKRRNVLRAATFYAASAWLIVQVATQVFPFFHIADWLVRWIVVAAAIGFPFAMLFSWFYEWTPQGIVREGEVAPDAAITRETGKRMDRWIMAVLGLAVVLLLTDRFAGHRESAAGSAAGAPASIAVLPFENLSEDKANAFFADGIQDEILTRLAKIGTLKVISRTSTQRYASRPDNLKAIAGQLGVANILEGSVQKSGDTVRINVQLIRADGDSQVWAETYDRKLDNVFGVESEVAAAIADALDAKLSGANQADLARKPTTNAQAWEANLRGVALYDRPDLDNPDVIAAGKSFEEAVRLDPGFASAWAALAVVDGMLVFTNNDTSTSRRDAARAALAQAVRLRPDSFETRRAQAYVAYFLDRDYERARSIFEQIRALAPSDAEIPRALALIARRQGRWDESDRLFDAALDLDPRNTKVLLYAAETRFAQRQFPQALRLLDRLEDVLPGDEGAYGRRANIYLSMGDLDRAQAALGRIRSDNPYGEFNLLRLQHRYPDGVTRLRKAVAEADPSDPLDKPYACFYLGEFQRLAGDEAGAKDSYTQALAGIDAVLAAQPDNAALLTGRSLVEAGLGRHDDSVRDARRAIAALPASRDALGGPGIEEALVRIQARFGDRDEAIAGLQHLLSTSYQALYNVTLTPAVLRLDPDFDGLRDDPRFRKLAQMADAPAASSTAGGKP